MPALAHPWAYLSCALITILKCNLFIFHPPLLCPNSSSLQMLIVLPSESFFFLFQYELMSRQITVIKNLGNDCCPRWAGIWFA